ncbi:MAG: hypothetical protein KC502_04755 [Myxococcales bacterium]|nr:hypothetical protein [Myxococcales bacterium]
MSRLAIPMSLFLLLLGLSACGGSSGSTGGAAATDAGADTAVASADTTSGGDSATSDAAAGDASGGDASAGGACGELTEVGLCTGVTLTWCEQDKIETVDCADAIGSDGQVGVCTAAGEEYGFVCAAKAGDTCAFADDEGGVEQVYCAGKDAGCVFDGTADTCKENVGTCDDDAIDTCIADYLVWGCEEPQPAVYDCAILGAKCVAKDDSATCQGVTEGKQCDTDVLLCASGLSCVGVTDDSYGTCTKP